MNAIISELGVSFIFNGNKSGVTISWDVDKNMIGEDVINLTTEALVWVENELERDVIFSGLSTIDYVRKYIVVAIA